MFENEEQDLTTENNFEEIDENYHDIPGLMNDIIDLDDDIEGDEDLEELLSPDSTSKRFAKILHQRNEARKEAETLKTKYQSFQPDDEDFDPRIYANQRNLKKRYPDSEKYFDKIEEYTSQNIGMSWELAYKIIKFDEQNDEATKNKKLAQKTMITGQTPSDIKNFKSFDHMSSREQFEYLKNQYKKGNLKI